MLGLSAKKITTRNILVRNYVQEKQENKEKQDYKKKSAIPNAHA